MGQGCTGSRRLLFSVCVEWKITNDAAEGKEKTDVGENSRPLPESHLFSEKLAAAALSAFR